MTDTALPFRVLELASPATAPCGRLLAEAGARVTRLVSPEKAAQPPDAFSLFHDAGKGTLEVDLATAEGRARLVELAASADVLLEGLAPGGLAERGLGYDRLRTQNPGLVLVSITPFGQDGPYNQFAADDLVVFAMGGVMFISGEPGRPPVVAPDQQSYTLAGAHAAGAALAALWACQRDGVGDWIDVSMIECWAAQENTVTNYWGPGDFARRNGSQHRTSLPGRIYPCGDGYVHLFISREEPVWERFLDWIGRPAELADPALWEINTRWRSKDLVDGIAARFVASKTMRELFESAQAAHLPCVPVNTLGEFLEDPQVQAYAPVAEVETPGGGAIRSLRPAMEPVPPAYSDGEPAHGEPRRTTSRTSERGSATMSRPSPPRTDRRPLDGVRVCAFTHVAAGPYATLQLAYLGAEVIKVESTTRIDYWRYRDRNNDPERSRPFADHNKNTRSVTLNLRTPEGVALAQRLASASDVVIDNFSAGVLDRIGLGYEKLRSLRPDAIVVHMTGLGSVGPRSRYVTFGPSLMAFCGITHLWNHPGDPIPVGSQSSYPDFLAGAYAAYATLVALHRRALTGRGALLDISQALVAASAIGPSFVEMLNGLGEPHPIGNASPTAAPHGCYACRGGDDAWCAIAVETDAQWQGLRRAMGCPEWAASPDLATAPGRLARSADLDAAVSAWTRTLTPREVMARCQAEGVPAGMVATGEDLVNDPHLAARGFLVEGEHPALGHLRLPGSPVRFQGSSTDVWRFGPLLGEDSDYVLRQVLGLSAVEIDRLSAAGALL